MNTIIIAALALLVLAVVAMVFMSRSNIFVSQTGSCQTNGGQCYEDCEEHGLVKANLPNMKCDDSKMDCCIAGERAGGGESEGGGDFDYGNAPVE